MGVIGLDLCYSGIGGVPQKLGRLRQKSRHKLNANNTLASADTLLAQQAPLSSVPVEPALALAPALVAP